MGRRKETLVCALEEEDEHATFERLFDLPPELRNRIYSMHFDTFKEVDLPTTPPITQTNRQLRQETLLLFYQTARVIINVSGAAYQPNLSARVWERSISKRFGCTRPMTGMPFEGLLPEYLGNIRRFRLLGIVATPTHWVDASWDVDLGNENRPIHVSAIEAGSDTTAPRRSMPCNFGAAREKYEARVKVGLESVMVGDGNLKLRRDDLRLLNDMFLPTDEELEGEREEDTALKAFVGVGSWSA